VSACNLGADSWMTLGVPASARPNRWIAYRAAALPRKLWGRMAQKAHQTSEGDPLIRYVVVAGLGYVLGREVRRRGTSVRADRRQPNAD